MDRGFWRRRFEIHVPANRPSQPVLKCLVFFLFFFLNLGGLDHTPRTPPRFAPVRLKYGKQILTDCSKSIVLLPQVVTVHTKTHHHIISWSIARATNQFIIKIVICYTDLTCTRRKSFCCKICHWGSDIVTILEPLGLILQSSSWMWKSSLCTFPEVTSLDT